MTGFRIRQLPFLTTASGRVVGVIGGDGTEIYFPTFSADGTQLLKPDGSVFSSSGGGGGTVATALTMTGPSTGLVGQVSSNYSVALSPTGGTVGSAVTVTPSDSAGGGTFSPTSFSLTTAAPSGVFTYTPASAGAKSISITNSGGLTNPSALAYTATASGGQGPTIVSAPAINGTPQVNTPLSITAGQTTGATSTVRSIYSGGALVAGPSAGVGYTPVFADGGKQFTVTEVATNATGSTSNPSTASAACLTKNFVFIQEIPVIFSTERVLPYEPGAVSRVIKDSGPVPINVYPSGNVNYQNNRPTTGAVGVPVGSESFIDDGGMYYARTRQVAITALSFASGVATATATAHGFAVGDVISVAGALDGSTVSPYNTDYQPYGGSPKASATAPVLSVPDANTFTYAPAGTPTTTPTTMPNCGPTSVAILESILP